MAQMLVLNFHHPSKRLKSLLTYGARMLQSHLKVQYTSYEAGTGKALCSSHPSLSLLLYAPPSPSPTSSLCWLSQRMQVFHNPSLTHTQTHIATDSPIIFLWHNMSSCLRVWSMACYLNKHTETLCERWMLLPEDINWSPIQWCLWPLMI